MPSHDIKIGWHPIDGKIAKENHEDQFTRWFRYNRTPQVAVLEKSGWEWKIITFDEAFVLYVCLDSIDGAEY
jgi:hypothetical protein